jgi:ribosome modulation factor
MTDDLTVDGPPADGSEHVWRLGREAGLAESAATANPYEPDTELAADWADGWREGDKLSHRSVDSDQAWAAWRAGADPGEPEHAHAP